MSKHTMSRRLTVAILLSVAVVVASEGVARADDDGAFVTGRGDSFQAGFTKHFTVSAKQRSSRTLAARGRVKVRQLSAPPTAGFSDFSFRGRVTCLRVEGNRAVIGVVILKGDGSATGQEGNSIHLFLEDGEPTNDPDRFDNSGYGVGAPDCTQAFVPPNGTVLEDGEIVVGKGDEDHDR